MEESILIQEDVLITGPARSVLTANITKNWGGNGWDAIGPVGRKERIKEIRLIVDELLKEGGE